MTSISTELAFHPLADVFPLLPPAAARDLAADSGANGQLEPSTLSVLERVGNPRVDNHTHRQIMLAIR